jgi:hypothetical protein
MGRRQTGWGLGGAGVVALLLLLRCANVDRGLGEACERNEDCLSGVCAGQVCIAQPPLLTSLPTTDAASSDAGHDGPAADAPVDAPTSGTDTSPPPVDAGMDAPPDTGAAQDGGAKDGTTGTDAAGSDGGHPADAHPRHDAARDAGASRDSGHSRG